MLVEVTEAGQALCDRFLPGIHRVEREVMSALSPGERDQLMALLGKVLGGAAQVASEEPIPLEGNRVHPTAGERRT